MPWSTIASALRFAVRWLSVHTGLPALLVGAVLVVVGYRVLKKTARFAFRMLESQITVALRILAIWRLSR